MGLTAERELALRDAGLIAFFDEHRQAFKEIAEAARGYTHDRVTAPVDLPLRPDDVAEVLVTALMTSEHLRLFLAEHKGLRQRYWYRHFADLVLDRLWEEMESGQTQQTTPAG